jgi:hypothetical protein
MRYHPLPKSAVPIVALATGLTVVAIGWGTWRHPAALWAPGNLSRHHADLGSCLQCHQPFRGVSASRCAACHSDQYFESRAMESIVELHRAMAAQRRECTACHTEHRGRTARITNIDR